MLGNTGLEISVIGFGASPLGGHFQVCSSGPTAGGWLVMLSFGSMAVTCVPVLSSAPSQPDWQSRHGVLHLMAGSCTVAPAHLQVLTRHICMNCLQAVPEAEAIRSVHEAFKLGINYVDCAPFYSNTKSEVVSTCASTSNCSSVVNAQFLGQQ
jgi:hypothetical protein